MRKPQGRGRVYSGGYVPGVGGGTSVVEGEDSAEVDDLDEWHDDQGQREQILPLSADVREALVGAAARLIEGQGRYVEEFAEERWRHVGIHAAHSDRLYKRSGAVCNQ